ncbi:PAS domain-containing protein [Fluviispira multicolorata]|uniref:PAS domain-containing protein n=1 Tax=Fluviispira multicolorata TaxID=2654512 RepID=A0A833JGV0_9BACT|nr:PAS domain-containing protein [Fluviispira multicolorata]KAB8032221.1 PAS domain-containing protein [Fluviispira multicolorata]
MLLSRYINNFLNNITSEKLLKSQSFFISCYNTFGEIVYVSQNCDEFYGYARDEFTKKLVHEYLVPDEIEYLSEEVLSMIYNVEKIHKIKAQIKTKSGKIIAIKAYAKGIYIESLEETFIIIISQKCN